MSEQLEANQAFLAAEFARLKGLFEGKPAEAAPAASEPAAAIDFLAAAFDLTGFERDILLLCAGVEMDSRLAELCGEAQGSSRQRCATFGVAMSVLPQPHWSALTPVRPLRRLRLVEAGAEGGLTSAPLRIDERILHYLAGINFLDPYFQTMLRPGPAPEIFAAGHDAIAAEAARILSNRAGRPRLIHFCGDDRDGQEDAAAMTARELGVQLLVAAADDLPQPGAEMDKFVSLWEREAVLLRAALLIQIGGGECSPAFRRLAERLPHLVFVASREPISLNRPFTRFQVDKPPPAEQKRLWTGALGTAAAGLNGTLDDISQHFRASARTIVSTATLAAGDAGELRPAALREACRSISRPRLDHLAQRIVPSSSWDDLVLPALQKQTLRQIAAQVRHRMKVHETWGFSAKGRRGLGVSALFSGESGTGKTMAAEVLADELDLDLYRIDLSCVVSKYIGETEKNLKQVFDAADEGGLLLLFDEADALFGKRSEVSDSHDRYANIEVSYLLQRMEVYQGLAILTTNLKSSLDRSFQRRLRFTLNFPFPDAAHREIIWSRVFPSNTPTRDLNAKRLSQLNVAGGNIRNIALGAAFLAAEEGGPVAMAHLAEAAKLEAQKIERPLSEAELRGWI
ncbi:MAG TPA: AAA family ATPase [Verrucomicrobiae bacterium]